MLKILELFFTCWMIYLSDGSVHCYCENEIPPVVERIESARTQQAGVLRLSVKEPVGDN